MAIKKAQYKITLTSGENTYHFETGDEMVKVVDDNGSVLGSFKEFAMEGKVVNSGSFTNLKVSGLYKVKGLSGLPSGYDTGKISILSVKAVGKVGSPELVSYDLISQNGDIFHNTVLNGRAVGWSEGGTSLKNTINTITNNIGDTALLKTSSKSSLVGAINSVKTQADGIRSDFNTLNSDYTKFKGHDHDNKYVIKSGDTATGNIVFANGKRVQAKTTTGATFNLIGSDDNNNIHLGNSGRPLKIAGSDITFNGSKVWHEGNDGSGSGLDADKLGGVDSSKYARRDGDNTFERSILTTKNLYAGSTLFFGLDYENRYGGIGGKSSGEINFYTKKERTHSIGNDGTFQSWNSHELFANQREVKVRLRLNSADAGLGMYRNTSSKYLGFYNWEKSERAGYIDEVTSEFHFDKPIHVGGRKLFLQSGTPSGSIPAGSIWIS